MPSVPRRGTAAGRPDRRQLFVPNDIYRPQFLTTSIFASGELTGGVGRSPEPEVGSPATGGGRRESAPGDWHYIFYI